jgi:hypothetical protein
MDAKYKHIVCTLYVEYVNYMQLDVTRDLSYATKAKTSYMCYVQQIFFTNDSCKRHIFY